MKLKNRRILNLILALVLTLKFNIFAQENICWNAQSFSSKDIPDIAYMNGIFVLASELIYTSNDAKQWELTFSPAIDGFYNQVYVLNNQFIATGENVQPIKSEDGKTWTPIRLHENISTKDIKVIGDTFFWNDSPKSFSYSKNLLTWNNIPIPNEEEITDIKFINDKCFLSTKTSIGLINCWILNEDFILEPLESSITSIDNICYLPETKSYININLSGVNLAKRLYIFTSADGIQWNETDFSINGNRNFDLEKFEFETLNLNDKIFLRLGNQNYVTSNGSIWFKINNLGNFKTLKYSGNYFYNINNSKDVFISKDGINWNNFSLPNEINPLSSINIYSSKLILNHIDYNSNDDMYLSTVYSHFINSYDENVQDITADNTDYSIGILGRQYTNTLDKGSEVSIETEDINQISLVFEIDSKKMKVLNSETKVVEEIELSVEPFIENNIVLFPLRDIITYLKGDLEWDSQLQTAKVNLNNKTLEIKITDNYSEIKIDNNILDTSANAKIIDGHIMIPIRIVIEQFGFKAEWKAETKEIELKN